MLGKITKQLKKCLSSLSRGLHSLSIGQLWKLKNVLPPKHPFWCNTMLHMVSGVEKVWLTSARQAPYLVLYGKFEKFDAMWCFLEAAMIPVGQGAPVLRETGRSIFEEYDVEVVYAVLVEDSTSNGAYVAAKC